MARLVRPTGVIILALLAALEGFILIIVGLFLAALAGVLGGLLFAVGGSIGGLFILFGIMNFVVAYGYWNGSGWAWIVGLILAIIGVIRALLSSWTGLISLLTNGLIIYYLTRPHVQRFFGKAPALTPPPPTPSFVPSPPSTPTSQGRTRIRCPKCGSLNEEDAKFCKTCGTKLVP